MSADIGRIKDALINIQGDNKIGVISAINRKGEVKILYIELPIGEEHQMTPTHVDKTLKVIKEYGSQIHHCLITVSDVQREIKVIYDPLALTWRLS